MTFTDIEFGIVMLAILIPAFGFGFLVEWLMNRKDN